ncbi:MAG TPA: hypothetical protein VG838_15555 [Opitutaceae bacterium]|nr:hypothetical protein [Opitutaceae bacterium]
MSALPSRKPWPMKWVVLAIILVIVPYTYLTLHYRKPGPAYRPYEDGKRRAVTGRLVSAGYQRIALDAQRPADPVRSGSSAETAPAPGGLPPALTEALIDSPVLPVSIDAVTAAGSTGAVQPYSIQFTCTLADNKAQPTGGQLYRHDNELILVPSFEKLDAGLLARTRDSTILLTVPAGALKPGRYDVRVVGVRASRRWTLQVH